MQERCEHGLVADGRRRQEPAGQQLGGGGGRMGAGRRGGRRRRQMVVQLAGRGGTALHARQPVILGVGGPRTHWIHRAASAAWPALLLLLLLRLLLMLRHACPSHLKYFNIWMIALVYMDFIYNKLVHFMIRGFNTK